MSATAGKVALVSTTTALTGACPTADDQRLRRVRHDRELLRRDAVRRRHPSNTTAVLRNGGGATDTDNNAADFTAGAPDPRPTVDPAPTVASTTPTNGATGVALGANITITFSEPVNVAGSGSRSSARRAVRTPRPPPAVRPPSLSTQTRTFADNESCTVTVLAPGVTDAGGTGSARHHGRRLRLHLHRPPTSLICGDPVDAASMTSRAPVRPARSSAQASPSKASSSATTRTRRRVRWLLPPGGSRRRRCGSR